MTIHVTDEKVHTPCTCEICDSNLADVVRIIHVDHQEYLDTAMCSVCIEALDTMSAKFDFAF